MKTLAAVLPRTGASLEIAEVDLAPPKDGEVLVRLLASGVCHSDLNAVDGTAETRCPAVLGHEGAGIVEAVGGDVSLRPGTRVALSWMPSCGRCEECLRALPHLCRTAWRGMETGGLLDGTPRLSRDGLPVYHYSYLSTFARHAVVPAACCIPIEEDVPAEVAAIVGCAVSTGLGAVWRTAGVRKDDRVAVFGCGGVGLSAVLIGIPRPDAVVSLPAATIPRQELRVLGSAYGSTWPERDFPATLDRYRSGRLPLDLLVTHRLPLDDAQRAIDLVRDGVPVRAVLELDGEDG